MNQPAKLKEKIKRLKAGDKIKLTHNRKGTFECEVESNDDGEWLNVVVLERVRGLANQWNKGDELPVRKEFILGIETIS